MENLRFRVVLDGTENVFRDIDISPESNFLELHECILRSFRFSGREMASFYLSNEEWDKGEEIALMDFSEPGQSDIRIMAETPIAELINQEGQRLLYLYDHLRMWIWYVELIAFEAPVEGMEYPAVVLSVGDAPDEYSKGMVDSFEVEDQDSFGEDFDESEFDSFDHPDADPYY